MKIKFLHYVYISWGFSIGIVSSLFIFLYLFPSFFDKPMDTFYSALIGIFATAIGSFIGGFIAYQIAINQTNAQFEREDNAIKLKQENIYQQIFNEITNNVDNIKKLNLLLKRVNGNFNHLSIAISQQNTEISEGILVHIQQVDIDLLIKLSEALDFQEYFTTHKTIKLLLNIKSLGTLLLEQDVPEYINYSLEKLLETSSEFIETYNQQKK